MLPGTTHTEPAIELISTFNKACCRADLTHDQVAGLLGLKKEQLYQQLRLIGHFSLTRLVRLRDDPNGRRFLRHYWPLMTRYMGFPDFSDKLAIEDAVHVLINAIQVQMGNAELDAIEAERKRA